ncbi:sensor histidine kinase [Herbiconiux sp. P15]|uniref:sensor histidine kinase n=1 Tax=Herbiconiux liukaitaii TaxID=3342799 RepID=UPI0035B9C1FC
MSSDALREADTVTPTDRIDYRRITLLTFGVILGLFATGASIQSVFVLGILPHSMVRGVADAAAAAVPLDVGLNLAMRLGANAAAVGAALAAIALLSPQERGPAGRVWTGLVIALSAAAVRAVLQIALGIYAPDDLTELTAELVTASVAAAISLVLALAQSDARRRLRSEERASALRALSASAALEALQGEELRVRREVADGLHGTVQHRFVLLGTRLEALLAEGDLDRRDPAVAAELRSIRQDLDALREQDLRGMSRLLYPDRLDQGAVPAVRALFQRVPATISTVVSFGDEVLELESHGAKALSPERRLLLVRIVEEALSNALKHGRATALELAITHADAAFEVTFDDNGTGLVPPVQLNGLQRLQVRLELVGGRLELSPAPGGAGTRLLAVVPDGIDRRATTEPRPPKRAQRVVGWQSS